jgi:uncharacterized DUF497 family protein
MSFVRRLRWTDWNVAHIARHSVLPEEVEQVCHGDVWTTETYSGRLRVIGPTSRGRVLTVILAPEGRGVYFPVTARPASRKERQAYADQKGASPS